LLGLIAWQFIHSAKADTLQISPSSCMGNWDGVYRAIGTPEVPWGKDATAFTTENSALYQGGDRRMYCGTFNVLNTNDKVLQRATLKLSAGFVNMNALTNTAPVNAPEVTSTTSSTISTETSTLEVPSTPATTTSVEPTPTAPTIPDTTPSSPITPENPPTAQPAPTPEGGNVAPPTTPLPESPAAQPTSFHLLPIAFAQEMASATTSSIPLTDGSSTVSSTLTDSTGSPIVSSGTPSVMNIGTELNRPGNIYSVPTQDELVQVFYSIDGEHWNALPSITPANVSSYEVVLPLENWQQVENLQINFQGVAAETQDVRLLLDGMSLIAEYSSAQAPTPPAPQVRKLPEERDTFDPQSRHTCQIEPFSKGVSLGHSTYVTALLSPSSPGLQPTLEVGQLPEGVTARLEPAPISSSTPTSTIPFLLHLDVGSNAATGSYNSILLYTETQTSSLKLHNFCQFNLVVQ
jgi:hypothetical protein